MSGKTATSTSTQSIPPEVLAEYQSVNANAQQVASTPYQAYSSDPNAFVAPINSEQATGIQNTNQAANQAQPYFNAGASMVAQGSQGVTPSALNVGQYLSPYLSSVLGSTQAIENQQNQQQQQQLQGNAITSGAFGGDRSGVALANLAQQQGLANNASNANIMNTGYNTALGAAQQQQGVGLQAGQFNQQLLQQGGQNLANIGAGAQGAALQGASAQLGAGQTEQQTQQAGLSALYNQFLQKQSYPFQTAQFLANIAEGTGSLSGSTTSTTQPVPFFSDARLKEDIEPIGKAFDGTNIVKFRYKGSPHTQIGFLAQDVEKRHPKAVGLAAGYKTVDYDEATKEAADRGHYYAGGLARSAYAYGGGDSGPYEQGGGGTPYLGGLKGIVPSAQIPVRQLPAPAQIPKLPQSTMGGLLGAGKDIAGAGQDLSNIGGLIPQGMKDSADDFFNDTFYNNAVNPGLKRGGRAGFDMGGSPYDQTGADNPVPTSENIPEQTPGKFGLQKPTIPGQSSNSGLGGQLLGAAGAVGGLGSAASTMGSMASGLGSLLPFLALKRGGRAGFADGGDPSYEPVVTDDPGLDTITNYVRSHYQAPAAPAAVTPPADATVAATPSVDAGVAADVPLPPVRPQGLGAPVTAIDPAAAAPSSAPSPGLAPPPANNNAPPPTSHAPSGILARAHDYTQYLENKGWSPSAAAGAVGNLWQESSLRPSVPGDNGNSFGLAQFNKASELPAFQQWAQQNGRDIADPYAQLDFLHDRMQTPQYAGTFAAMNKASDPGSAAAAFMQGYERPAAATAGLGKRINYANMAAGANPADMPASGSVEAQSGSPPAGLAGNGDQSQGGVGGLIGNVGNWASQNQNVLIPILKGLGAMASSQSLYPGAAMLQGLGAGAQSYSDLQLRQSQIAKNSLGILQQRFTPTTDANGNVAFFDHTSGKLINQQEYQSIASQIPGIGHGGNFNAAQSTAATSAAAPGSAAPAIQTAKNIEPIAPAASVGAPTSAPGAGLTNQSAPLDADQFDPTTIKNNYLNSSQLDYNKDPSLKNATNPHYMLDQANALQAQIQAQDNLYHQTGSPAALSAATALRAQQAQYNDNANKALDTALGPQYQNAKDMATARADTMKTAQANLTQYNTQEHFIKDLAAVASRNDLNRGSDGLADWIGTMRTYAGNIPLVKQVVDAYDTGGYQSAHDIIEKLSSAQASQGVTANGLGGAPEAALTETLKQVANPAVAPAAKYHVLRQQEAQLLQNRQYYTDFLNPKTNKYIAPANFTQAWAAANPWDNFDKKAKAIIPAAKGMSPQEWQDNDAYGAPGAPPQPTMPVAGAAAPASGAAPAQTAPRATATPATIHGPSDIAKLAPGTPFVIPYGPNKGKVGYAH